MSSLRRLTFCLLGIVALTNFFQPAQASSAAEIEARVRATMDTFFNRIPGAREIVKRSSGVLVFPSVVKAGIGVGGEYGEGALVGRDQTIKFYNTISASLGLQLGAQVRSVVIVFMTDDALEHFRRADGWKVGVDGSVAIVTAGVGGAIDSSRITQPVVGFIFDGKGLMYNLTLEGSKISKISR
jgi:lipid-binding SYLF domain-containing protein